ncbi:hypothetical protein QJS10_CPA03g02221 [Acorus calamus]|uniref:Uncharacterized protein n=1 Tax=Acorus calamus TaxID=4465 RepID=A0AAV9F4V1_ACOCL|nr:hypothetical protein QJS10_CPA03g02221 [Acorus calamus]
MEFLLLSLSLSLLLLTTHATSDSPTASPTLLPTTTTTTTPSDHHHPPPNHRHHHPPPNHHHDHPNNTHPGNNRQNNQTTDPLNHPPHNRRRVLPIPTQSRPLPHLPLRQVRGLLPPPRHRTQRGRLRQRLLLRPGPRHLHRQPGLGVRVRARQQREHVHADLHGRRAGDLRREQVVVGHIRGRAESGGARAGRRGGHADPRQGGGPGVEGERQPESQPGVRVGGVARVVAREAAVRRADWGVDEVPVRATAGAATAGVGFGFGFGGEWGGAGAGVVGVEWGRRAG